MTTLSFSSGGLVLNPDREVLIVNQNHRSWSLPKGHIEPGETPLQAAYREIEEETGVTELKLHRELGTYRRYKIGKNGGEDKQELKVITLFLFTTSQLDLAPKDPNNPEAKWVSKKSVPDYLTHPADIDFYLSLDLAV